MSSMWYLADSAIHGHGAFASRDLDAGVLVGSVASYIGSGPLDIKQTVLGRLVNHQKDGNCELRKEKEYGGFKLYTLVDVPKDDELVSNYEQLHFPFNRSTQGFNEL